MSEWNRASFRVGAADYDALNATEQQEEPPREREGRDDGQGAAGMGGAPRPSRDGSELAVAVYSGLDEQTHEANEATRARSIAAERDAELGPMSATAFAAGIAAMAAERGPQGREDGPQPQPTGQQFDATPQAPEPGYRASMKAEQSAADIDEPFRPDLMKDYVTDNTKATIEAERAQERQRPRAYGLTL